METIYWYSLVEDKEDFCRESIDEMVKLLSLNYPSLPPLHTERLSDELVFGLNSYLCQSPTDITRTAPPELLNKKIIVYCEREAEFAINARKEEPMARFGAARLTLYAMVWTPNKYVFWHEALHLLDVPESYNHLGQTTCEEQSCIMQWNPNRENCTDTLILCKNAINKASTALNGSF